MLQDIIHLQYRQYSEKDLANPHELNIVNMHIDEVKAYFSSYDFNSAYTLENIADYCLVTKIEKWDFKSYLTDEYKDIFDKVKQDFKDFKAKFCEKNVVLFLNNYDFTVPRDLGYDLCYAIYSILPKFYQSLTEETYERAINKEPYLVLDSYDEYKSVFKKFPSLYAVLFSEDNLSAFLEHRMESLIRIGANICINKDFPSADVQNKIKDAFDKLGKKILDNTDIELALRYQITYKSVLKFFKAISSSRYNYYDEHRYIVDDLNNRWLEEKGHSFSYEIPFDEIKKQFDNPSIPWYLKQIMLTHSRNSKKEKVEHFSVHAMQIGRKSLTELVSTNLDTNDHFGMMTQQLIGIYNNIYCNALNYYISNPEKWGSFYNNTENILLYIFKIINEDISQVQRQLQSLYKKGQEYLFNKELKEEDKQDVAIDFTQINITLIECILRIIYIAEKKEANSFYNPDKLTLGILLNYYDINNPLTKILTVELMQYLSYCLIRDKDEKSREVGLNLRNSIAHGNFDRDKFNNANGILALLLLTSAINALFLYYNNLSAERNKEKLEKEQIRIKAIKARDNLFNELKKYTEEGKRLLEQLHEQYKKIPGIENIDENQDVEDIRAQLQDLINGEAKDSDEFKKYLEILNKSDLKELQVSLKFIDYYLFLYMTRQNLFSEKYSQYMKELEDKGLFFCMMSTPDIPEEILFSDDNVELVGQLYALKLREILKNVILGDNQLSRCYEDAINLYEDKDFSPCALTLMRSISENIKVLEKTVFEYSKSDKLSAFDYYESSANKILNFYNQINRPLEQWDGKSLNYGDMQKDNPTYTITDLDCIKLFILLSPIKELSALFQVLNWLLKKQATSSEIKNILENYRK